MQVGTLQYDDVLTNCNGRWHGLNDAYEFDFGSAQLNGVQPMGAGRWYPTLITTANGKIFAFNGTDEFGVHNRLVEVYDDSTKTWSIKFDPTSSIGYCIGEGFDVACPGAGQPCFGGTAGSGVSPIINLYPRMHVLPSGLIAIVGMYPQIRKYNPSTGAFTLLNNSSTFRHYGSSFLLPLQNTAGEEGAVLLVGGSPTAATAATASVEIVDFNASSTGTPVIRTVESLQHARKYAVPVILPDGKLVIFGGASVGNSDPVYHPEMFDPVTETWTILPAATVPRVYHGVALLLYDGRVWVAGSTPSRTVQEMRTEIFKPWYYSETRPIISGSPVVEGYGGTITIPTPDADDITSVSLLRLMSATHHFEANQRFLWLQILNKTSNSIVAAAPLNGNLAPPGYYMIHVLNSAGVPSTAKFIKIPGDSGGDATPPSQVTGLAVAPMSPTRLNLTWLPNPESDIDHYNIYRDVTTGFIPTNATLVNESAGTAYSDMGLDSGATYYYVVAAVDATGNIGPASAEMSGTTESSGAGEVFYDVPFPGNGVGPLFNGASTRFGEEAILATSVIIGKSLSKWTVYLRRVGSASGTVSAVVRSASNDAVVATFTQTLDAASLPTSFTPFDFTLPSPHVIQTGDKILIEYSGTSRVELSVWTTDKIDGNRTRRIRYAGTTYVSGNTHDIVGSMNSSAIGNDTTSPVQPTGFAVLPAGPTQMDLSWNANPEADIDHYNIHRGSVSGFTPSDSNRIAQVAGISYSDTGLAAFTTYYYVVAAADSAGNIGPPSIQVAGTTESEAGAEVFYDVPFPGNGVGPLFNGASTRFGEEAILATSVIIGKSLSKWTVYLRRVGSASGTVSAVVRSASNDAVVATFTQTLDAASLPTSFTPFDFTLPSPHVIQTGDKILIEYSGTSRVELSVWTTDKIDGNRTRRIRYAGTTYVSGNTHDIVGRLASEQFG